MKLEREIILDKSKNNQNSKPIPIVKNTAHIDNTDKRTAFTGEPLQAYIQETKKYKLLSREEVVALAIKIRDENDQNATDLLISSNLRLVVKIAIGLNTYWTNTLFDLIQEGNIGLMHAVDKFDPDRGIKFSYYASFWIKAYILKFIIDNWRLVKLGTTQAQRKLFFNLTKERKRLTSDGFTPEPRQLAKRLNVKVKDVEEMSQRLLKGDLSLDAPVGEASNYAYGSFLIDPKEEIDEQLSYLENREILVKNLQEFRKTLTNREADIFDLRILTEETQTLQALGEKHHVSRERIRQIQKKLVEKIRRWLEIKIPDFREVYSAY